MTGFLLISKEDLPRLENTCKKSLFLVSSITAKNSRENIVKKKTRINKKY